MLASESTFEPEIALLQFYIIPKALSLIISHLLAES